MEENFDANGVSGVLHRPDGGAAGGIALTHGAGSDCRAPLLVRLARSFAESGYTVLRYDLPFRLERRPPHPASAARDREGIVRAADTLKGMVQGPIIAGGHSYGGRQTTMAAAERPGLADALLLLSYPLHPPKKPEQKRTAHFPELRIPALFVHGTADPFASIEELRDAVTLIPARTDVLAVERAGHDLKRAADMATEILTRLRALL